MSTDTKPITVMLDRERTIEFKQRAIFRMGSLPAPFEFADLQRPRKSYAALVAWIWSCLVPEDAADFATPEDLAQHIAPERKVCRELTSKLADAVNAGAPKVKNAGSSTTGTSQ